MGRFLFFFFGIIFFPFFTIAFEDPRSIALAKSNLALNNQSLWGANPAGLAIHLSEFEFIASNQYLIPELNIFSCSYILPKGNQSFALGIAHWGHPYFYQNRYVFNYVRSFNAKLQFGLRFRLHHNYFKDYETYFELAPDIGIRYSINTKNSLAFAIEQINLNHQITYTQTALKAGYAYHFSDKITMCFQSNYSQSQHSIHVGMEYKVLKEFVVRTGFQTESTAFTFGFAYSINRIQLDLSCNTHPVLGYSTALGLRYEL